MMKSQIKRRFLYKIVHIEISMTIEKIGKDYFFCITSF